MNIPSTYQVRNCYSIDQTGKLNQLLADGFDAWLAEVEAEAVRKFVREQNAEYRKTLGRVVYSVFDEV